MKVQLSIAAIALIVTTVHAQRGGGQPAAPAPPDPVRPIVARLDLEKYKATVKGLTQFGDRRQGTERNRKATDWIEAQLRSYGCQNIARITYTYTTPPPRTGQGGGGAAAGGGAGRGGGQPGQQPAAADPNAPPPTTQGGARPRGVRARTGVNSDPLKQPNEALRALNMEPAKDGERQEVYCQKIGSTHPEEGYIVAGHMDGHGWGEAANDDGSGTAIVMELARILNMPDVVTDRTIIFALWNNEETGLNGSRAYAEQRGPLQGKENPPGSGRYPEPKWLGMFQHDMMMFDHGMPRADGTVSPEQRPEADVNIEFQINSKFAEQSKALAHVTHLANEKYATDYPANIGSHMTNTDSSSFMDLVASISLRENERGAQIGNGWDPHWHQPTDVYTTFSDKDFRLGLNAAQSTLGAIGMLTNARLK